MAARIEERGQIVALLLLLVIGCAGEPSEREVKNARAFEALLSAVSLRNAQELERNARAIDNRHAAGELSNATYTKLQKVIEKARARDWNAAELCAYDFRAQFGDDGAYFK